MSGKFNFKLPKYRAGHSVKILQESFVSRVIRLSYDSGHTFYLVKNREGKEHYYAESELERV